MPRSKPKFKNGHYDKAKARYRKEQRLTSTAADPNAFRRCGKKKNYSKTQARSAAARMTKLDGKPSYPYKCDICGDWHLGHRPPGIDDDFYDENGARIR